VAWPSSYWLINAKILPIKGENRHFLVIPRCRVSVKRPGFSLKKQVKKEKKCFFVKKSAFCSKRYYLCSVCPY